VVISPSWIGEGNKEKRPPGNVPSCESKRGRKGKGVGGKVNGPDWKAAVDGDPDICQEREGRDCHRSGKGTKRRRGNERGRVFLKTILLREERK